MLGFRDRGSRRARLAALVLALGTALVVGAVACGASSSTSLPPTTGILIRAETLTAGRGCGTEATQLFKYVVVVFQYGGGDPNQRASYDAVVTSNVFDCYTDGAFISLPTIDGNATFRLEVFAYNRPAYALAPASVDAAAVLGRARTPEDRARLATFAGELRERTSPTWTTECTATQQENVQALASCDPLAPGLSGLGGGGAAPTRIALDTARFELPDGRIALCAAPAEAPDAGGEPGDEDAGEPDAGSDEDAGEPDAGPGDAGAPLSFAKVRVRARIGAQVIADSVVTCPAPFVAEVVPEPLAYELDVGLLDSAGARVDPGAQTLCAVTSRTGATSSAVCPTAAP
ncbi:MAG: hypothetical protein KIS78_17625 [Labilithrix sp.]|nr:hypothetical protein [Labilithrix sp.]MCW5834223.1 hypothetical protein [Labilithrix sp.]